MKLSWMLFSSFVLFLVVGCRSVVNSVLVVGEEIDDEHGGGGNDGYGGGGGGGGDGGGDRGGVGGIRGLSQLFDDVDDTTIESPGEWETITHDPFDSEDNCNFVFDGEALFDTKQGAFGSDSTSRLAGNNNNDYVFKGHRALQLRADGAAQHKRNHDVRDYVNLRLRCWITVKSWKDNDERYVVKYSSDGGSSWTTMTEGYRTQDSSLVEGRFSYLALDFAETGELYDLDTRKAKLRLEQVGGKNDFLYFDECWFEGYRTNGPTLWNVITYDDFEDEDGDKEGDWGSFTKRDKDDDKDAHILKEKGSGNEGENIPEGDFAMRIRNSNGKESSVYQENWHNVTGCSHLRISFIFCSRILEKNEGFVLQYASDDSGWTKVKEYIKGDKEDDDDKFYFKNNGRVYVPKKFDTIGKERFYHETVTLDVVGDAQARIRFRSKSKGDKEAIYIDNVLVECGMPKGD